MPTQLIPLAWDYVKSNFKSILISGLFSLTGTGLSTYGFFKHDFIMLILGPIIATLGKVILGTIIFYPIVKEKIVKRIENRQIIE